MTRLAGKTAIVTGAANGIGLACARRLAADGAAVALADISAEAGEAAAKTLRAEGARAIFVTTDVTQRAAIAALVDRAANEFGGLDIMINNAGVAITAPVLDTRATRFSTRSFRSICARPSSARNSRRGE